MTKPWAGHPQATNPAYAVNPRALWPGDPLHMFTTAGRVAGEVPYFGAVAAVGLIAAALGLTPVILGLAVLNCIRLRRIVRDCMKLTALFSIPGLGVQVLITAWDGREGPAWDAARAVRQLAIDIRLRVDERGGAPGPTLARQLADLDGAVWVFATAEVAPSATTTAAMVALADRARAVVEEMGNGS